MLSFHYLGIKDSTYLNRRINLAFTTTNTATPNLFLEQPMREANYDRLAALGGNYLCARLTKYEMIFIHTHTQN